MSAKLDDLREPPFRVRCPVLRRVALLSLLVLAPASAHAHDYWLAPRDYTPAVGEPVTVDLFVGDHLVPQSSRPHDPDKADSFTLRHRCSHEDLTRSLAAGADPVLERAATVLCC